MALRATQLDEKPTKWISPNKCDNSSRPASFNGAGFARGIPPGRGSEEPLPGNSSYEANSEPRPLGSGPPPGAHTLIS